MARNLRTAILCPLVFATTALLVVSCVDEDEYPDSPQGNFEALWRIIDEHYCFFDYKQQQYGLDWDEVHARYQKQFNDGMTTLQQFEVLANMLGELRDGHVNIYTPFDVARNWTWHEDHPSNFSDSLLNKYLGTNYRIAAGIKYRILDDNIGYLRYASFTSSIGEGNLDEVLTCLAPCNALIIDIRNNSGGLLSYSEQLAARFINQERLVGYMQHKTGPGHNDFSAMKEQRLKPSQGVRWQKPVVVLTNRMVYSAANEFVKYMKQCPNVTVVGDQTGGGAGMPFSSELPCGWSVRFSACPMYDVNRQPTEFGIQPDHHVALNNDDRSRGIDTIIEYARQLLNKH